MYMKISVMTRYNLFLNVLTDDIVNNTPGKPKFENNSHGP